MGGLHWWWGCPETGRRYAKLYLPNGGRRFLSRGAYGLVYASQAEDAIMRAHRRAARVHGRLGSDERLVAQLDEAETALNKAHIDGALRILGWRRG